MRVQRLHPFVLIVLVVLVVFLVVFHVFLVVLLLLVVIVVAAGAPLRVVGARRNEAAFHRVQRLLVFTFLACRDAFISAIRNENLYHL